MGHPGKRGGSGKAWVVLLSIPPLVILAGVVALFVWQARHGEVTPKWRKKPAVTNRTERAAAPDPGRPVQPPAGTQP